MQKNNTLIKENNFNILRFIAALMVIAGHMAYIMGSTLPILWNQGIHTLGVKIFFLIGGYLITKSWISDSNIFRFFLKRIFRILPALIAYVCVATFIIGPFISTLSFREYFSNPRTFQYLGNIVLHTEYFLPGVFENNPYPNAVNGSLWTLPVEAIMYFIVPFLLTISKLQEKTRESHLFIICVTVAVCCVQLLHILLFPEWQCVIYGIDITQALSLIPYYLIGMIFSLPEVKKILNLQVATVIILLYSCFNFIEVVNELMMYIIFPYFVFSIALTEKPYFKAFFAKHEISYGLYLYGFFIQQIMAFVFVKIGIMPNISVSLIICVLITSIVALLSSVFIEIPAQKLCGKFIAILQPK